MPPLKLVRPPLLCAKNAGAVSPPRRKNVPVLPGSGLVFGYPQQKSSKTEEQVAAQRQASLLLERHRQVAIRMDELAAHMGSEADARSWMRSRICSLTACLLRGHAEYEAVSDPLREIPEQRIADVGNKYVREIGASEGAHCTSTRSDSFPATTSPARTQYSTIYEAHAQDCGRALSFQMRSRGVSKMRGPTRKPVPGWKRGQTPIRFDPPNTGSLRNCFPRAIRPVQRVRRSPRRYTPRVCIDQAVGFREWFEI